ncbi:hypothetical protein MMC28_003005 [Mycoblastus sanguinarius]|nr:hypothetical protein [Mycoblastus sanguinarius]
MPFFKKSLAGPGYIVLNVIRVLNIIALLAVVAASSVMLVKTFVVSKFFFFDGVTHIITAFVGLGLIITEVGLFKRYIANNWPLLSPSSGFVTLGILLIILGVSILGNLNKAATSEKSLGGTFWRLVIASGIVVSIMGVVNIFASYMFRHKSLDITAREVRAHGATAPQKPYISPATSTRKRSFHLNRSASDTLPTWRTTNTNMYEQQSPTRNISAPMTTGGSQPAGQFDKFKGSREAGADARAPVVNGVQRPDLAFHPALQGGEF